MQGNQGNQGNQGLTGVQGNQGRQGNQGNVGSQGNQGNQGLQGGASVPGVQGYQGNVGAQGNQGSVGTGVQGNQGNQGAAGASGVQGNQGNQGTFTGSALTQNLNASDFAFYNYENGNAGSWTSLASNGSTTALAVDILGSGYTLTASHKFVASLGCRVFMYLNSDHTYAGYMDIITPVNIATDGSSVCTCTFRNTVIPDVSALPPALAGAVCTVAASSNGFTVSASRPAGTAASVWVRWWVNNFQDTT